MRRPRLPGAVAEAEARALQASEDPRSPPARPVAAKFIGQALTPTADTAFRLGTRAAQEVPGTVW
jgi:hypothetical protein